MCPRIIGSAWEVRCPAKLNLYLEIIGRQDSGYHELETLMVPIRLVDTLRWTPESTFSKSSSFDSSFSAAANIWQMSEGSLSGRTLSKQVSAAKLRLRVVPTVHRQTAFKPCAQHSKLADHQVLADENNLVMRAARLIARRAGIQPHGSFVLYKRIPTHAGLGGGSSDAAATLVLANCVWQLGYSQTQLLEMAASLGSDVPFFIATSRSHDAAICRGRGEQVESIGSLGRLHFVLVKPAMGLSTQEIFEKLDAPIIQPHANRKQPMRLSSSQSQVPLQQVIRALRRGTLRKACQSMTNRLESVAMANCNWLRDLRNEFKQYLCCGQWMTGSGSTYVALVHTARQAKAIAGRLRARQLGTVYTTTSY